MSQLELQQALQDLPNTGRLIKDRPYRQVWRFEIGGKGLYLKFYPRRGKRIKRMLRGDPAIREFVRLQWLQKAGISAPRATAVLKGFRIGQQIGDAVILEAVEPAVALDQLFNDAELAGREVPNRHAIVQQVIAIVRDLAKGGLGHTDLHLGNFLLKDGVVYLLDAYAVRKGGLRLRDLMLLGHSAAPYAARAEMVSGWIELGPVSPMPAKNSISRGLWKKASRRALADNAYFGAIQTAGGWSGYCFKRTKFAYPWSAISGMEFESADWARAWETLSVKMAAGELKYLKRSESGDVMAAEIEVGGRKLELVIKLPLRKQSHRYVTDVLRGDRALRAWKRAWELIARDIPTAWPVMILRRTVMGYPMESAVVFERVIGKPLARVDLEAMSRKDRDGLFRRLGRLLRRIDETGYYHRDAKSDNVMVDRAGRPILVDLDGVRTLTFGRWSLPRMLASMKAHKQYTPADSMALCRGYAPFAEIQAEQPASQQGDHP